MFEKPSLRHGVVFASVLAAEANLAEFILKIDPK